MKKILVYNLILSLLVILFFASCGSKAKTTYLSQLKTPEDSLSYYLGAFVGHRLKEGNNTDFNDSIFALIATKENKLPIDSLGNFSKAEYFLGNYITNNIEKKEDIEYKFLEKNLHRKNIIVTKSGLQYEVHKEGLGINPAIGDTLDLKLIGKRLDGVVFQNLKGKYVFSGRLSGLSEGVRKMKAGSHYTFYLHPNLAYGSKPSLTDGKEVKKNMVAIFDIEIYNIIPVKDKNEK